MITLLVLCLCAHEAICREAHENLTETNTTASKGDTTVLQQVKARDGLVVPEIHNRDRGHTAYDNNASSERKDEVRMSKYKNEATVWRIDATYAAPVEEDNNSTDSNERPVFEKPGVEKVKDFRPSPQLENDFESGHPTPTHYSPVPLSNNGPVEFRGADKFIPSPIDPIAASRERPDKFIDLKVKLLHTDVESKPTVGSPITVPAGGYYKQPVVKDRPILDFKHNFNLQHHEDLFLKKRSNPWYGLARLLSAAIPVGLFISALTPNIITVQNAEKDEVLETRRTGGRVPSESCKRRLLCELNKSIQQRRKQKQRPKEENCMKHLCSDSSNLQELMQLINSRDSPLTHNTNGDIITR